MYRALTLAVLFVWLAGCAPTNREELAQEVLKVDPSFRSVLDKREGIMNRLETYKRELALKRSSVDQSIAQLREGLTTAAKLVRVKTLKAKKMMEPDRDRIKLELSTTSKQLRAARSERGDISRAISKLKKTLSEKNQDFTPEELSRQQVELKGMQQDIERLEKEIADFKKQVRLLKIKLVLIRI